MIVVSDATSLILLAKLSNFQLLKKLYQKVYIPKEVFDDVVTRGRGKPGDKELTAAQGNWVEVRVISHRDKFQELQDVYGLGEGEAAAIILSQELKANFFFTDDRLARKVAPNFLQGIAIIVSGTIGILKSAKDKGLISKDQLKSKIESLKQEGFYLKENLYQEILQDIEEN